MEQVTKVVERVLAPSLLPNNRVHPQPVEYVFIVIIERAPPGFPCPRSTLHRGYAISGVLQISPDASGTVVKISCYMRQGIAELFGRSQAAARAKNIT